ncbi:MAG: hypothetical protein QM484_08700 [Woeseiaceae bacterium]
MNDKEKFQDAYSEIQRTTDPLRYDYLKWIGYHMWKLFDYESGLEMINSKEAYAKHRPVSLHSAKQDIQRRDETGEPITSALKRGLFPDI